MSEKKLLPVELWGGPLDGKIWDDPDYPDEIYVQAFNYEEADEDEFTFGVYKVQAVVRSVDGTTSPRFVRYCFVGYRQGKDDGE